MLTFSNSCYTRDSFFKKKAKPLALCKENLHDIVHVSFFPTLFNSSLLEASCTLMDAADGLNKTLKF